MTDCHRVYEGMISENPICFECGSEMIYEDGDGFIKEKTYKCPNPKCSDKESHLKRRGDNDDDD